jgi:hypothetical protein
MRRNLIIGCTLLGFILAAGGGFSIGIREGWNLAFMENAVHIGVVALPRLDAARTGRASELDKAFEFDIDSGLVWSHHLLESPLSGFLAPVWGISSSAKNSRDIVRLANYRKAYPSPTKPDVFDDVDPQTMTPRRVNQGPTSIDERLEIINDMVRRYATRP